MGVVLGLLAILGLSLLLVYVILTNTSAFAIASIDAEATEHISAESIARLANVAEGTTLLTVNEEHVRENLRKNPWVGSVEIIREFPDRLRIDVTERSVGTLVVMGNGTVVWCLGTDDVWIEPLEIETDEGQTVSEAALAEAASRGALLVTDVPASVSPQAACPATDDALLAVTAFKEQLSPEFLARIVSMSAPSAESVSCVLESGIKVSLGSASGIPTKEALVTQLLGKYPNRLTYINVRVPSNPSYRLIDADSMRGGTGATGNPGWDAAADDDVAGAAGDEEASGYEDETSYGDDDGYDYGDEGLYPGDDYDGYYYEEGDASYA